MLMPAVTSPGTKIFRTPYSLMARSTKSTRHSLLCSLLAQWMSDATPNTTWSLIGSMAILCTARRSTGGALSDSDSVSSDGALIW